MAVPQRSFRRRASWAPSRPLEHELGPGNGVPCVLCTSRPPAPSQGAADVPSEGKTGSDGYFRRARGADLSSLTEAGGNPDKACAWRHAQGSQCCYQTLPVTLPDRRPQRCPGLAPPRAQAGAGQRRSSPGCAPPGWVSAVGHSVFLSFPFLPCKMGFTVADTDSSVWGVSPPH